MNEEPTEAQAAKSRRDQFIAWIAGATEGPATFKDLMDAVKNGLASGALAGACQAQTRHGWWGLAVPMGLLQLIGFVGAVLLALMSTVQVFAVMERLPIPRSRRLALAMMPLVMTVFIAAAIAGWVVAVRR